MTAVADRAAPRPGPQEFCSPFKRWRERSWPREAGEFSRQSVAPSLAASGVCLALVCVGAAIASVTTEPRILITVIPVSALAVMLVTRILGRVRGQCAGGETVPELARVDAPVPAVTIVDGAAALAVVGTVRERCGSMSEAGVASSLRPADILDAPGFPARLMQAHRAKDSALIAACDAAKVVAFAVRLLDAQANRTGVRVLCETDGSIPPAACGQRDCRSAVLSLIGNALRISGPGDTVRIRLRAVRGAVLLRVAAEARQDRRAAVEALATARGLVEANGGSLFVECGLGCATVASMRLALADGPSAGGASAEQRSSPAAIEVWNT
jgi:hypothetical protein